MTSEEREQALILLGTMAEALGQEAETARLLLLLEDLDDIPLAQLKTGIGLARRECRFIPAPVELRALCRRPAAVVLGPSLAAIRAERERVRGSWKQGPPIPTLQEMADSCYANATLAERQAQGCRDAIGRRMPGDLEINALRLELERHLADYRHWSGYVGYYRERVAKEGGAVVPKVGAYVGAVRQAPAPDRRLPREPGDDEEEVSA